MLADRVPVKRVYRTWDDTDKAAILQAALRLRAQEPQLSQLSLLKRAQQILAPEKQRQFSSVGTPNYRWFRDGLNVETQSIPAARNGTHQEPKLKSPVIKILPPDFTEFENALQVLEEIQRSAAENKTRLERIKNQFTPTDNNISELLHVLNSAFTENYNSLQNLREVFLRGWADVRGEMRKNADLLDKIHSVVCNLAHNMHQLERRPTTTVPVTEISEPPRVKPRILVLGIDSGHWKNHIRDTAGDLCRLLDFQLVSGEPTPYREWDRVLATKKVPSAWLAKAKSGVVDKDRLVVVDGSAAAIANAVQRVVQEWQQLQEKEKTQNNI